MKLTGFFHGDRSGKVRWLAHELGLDVTDTWIRPGENRAPAFVEKSPLGVIPIVELDDGRVLRESNAIAQILIEASNSDLDVPPGDPLRYEYLMWLATFSENLETKLVECAISRSGRIDPEVFEVNAPGLRRRLPILAAMMPTEGYLLGRFTYADIVAAYSFRLAIQTGLMAIPAVDPWFSRCRARPAAQQAQFFNGL